MRKTSLRRWLLILLAAGLVLPAATGFADEEDKKNDPFAEDEDEDDDFFDSPTSFTPEQAGKAIAKGAMWLRKNQLDDGSWGPIVGNAAYGGGQQQGGGYTHPAGSTALAIYTLLKCKVPIKDPSVKKGFAYLKKYHEKPGGSYETAMMLLAVCATGDPYKTGKAAKKRASRLKLKGRYRGWAQKLLNHLIEKREAQGWRYNVQASGSTPGGSEDLSSTQLAALALFAAHRFRLRAKSSVWEDILDFSLAQQDEDGPVVTTKDPITKKDIKHKSRGFAYIKGLEQPDEGQATGAMTACGIANVMMARFVLMEGGKKKAEWDTRPDAKKVQSAVEDGITWLAENWNPYANPKKQQMNIYHLYWLYAVERAMDLTGQHRIGERLWYSDMGQQLLNHQAEDGAWDSGSTHEPRKVLDTCFALLFLKKATSGQIPFPSITGGSDERPVDNR